MIIVRIELWPHGDHHQRRELGVMLITNDRTGSDAIGNYDVHLGHAGKFAEREGVFSVARVEGHNRQANPWQLARDAITAALRSNETTSSTLLERVRKALRALYPQPTKVWEGAEKP